MGQRKIAYLKAILVLPGIFTGMILGAVIIYFLVGLIYLAIYGDGPAKNSEECARGMAIGYLSIFGGGMLGAFIGGVGILNSLKSPEMNRGEDIESPAQPES
jgi:hypothetical protein